MPTVPRLVLCPKCRVLLEEPPPGNPLYQCGKCSTTLQAKHAAPKDLEASRRSAEQRRSSYSDSSSGEISSDAVADEYPLTENGDGSPVHNTKQSVTQTAPENGSPGRQGQDVRNPWRGHSLDRVKDPYPKSVRNLEQDVTTQRVQAVVSGTESPEGRAAEQKIGPKEDHWPSSHDASNEMSVFPAQSTEVQSRTDVAPAADELETMASVGRSYGTEPLTSESRTNGNFLAGELQQLQEAHVPRADPDSSLESAPQTIGSNNDALHLRALPSRDPHDDNNGALQRQTVAGIIATGPSRTSKLRWQGRESDSGDEAVSSGAASSKGISEDDDGSSQDDAKSSSVSNKGSSTPIEYKAERSLRTVQSRRRSLGSQDRRSPDERQAAAAEQQQHHQQLLRAPSDKSDRTADMYESSAHVQDYEPSDTSSTTMDEMESNGGGGGGSGQFSGELDRQPSPSLDQPASRSVPKLNLPRSTTNSSRGSALSEEGSSYGSPSRLEMLSPENPPNNAARRHSWDERTLSRMGAAASGGYTGPQQGASSVRMKSPSQDFGGGQRNPLLRMSSVSSDPGGRLPSATGGRQLPASSSYERPSSYALRPQAQQQWVNRYVQPSQSLQQQWSPNSPHRPYFPEPSPLHPLQSRLSASVRQVPGGQLPPKQGHYPPLPPPGALPHVLCQHCGVLLAVPDNLPPIQKNTQKLRCGSCRKISIFSVPQGEGSSAAQVYGTSRSDSLQNQSMLASSPDSQVEFSTFRNDSAAERQKSVRRHTVSEFAEKQVQAPLMRKHSLGNEDLAAADQEMAERALSERVEALAINSAASSPSSFVPWTEFRSPSSQKSSQSGEIPYHKAASPRISQNAIAPGDSDVDSESDSLQRSVSATSSPQLNQGSSRSSPPLPNYTSLQDPKSGARAVEESQNEGRGLNVLGRFFKKNNRGAQYRRKVVVNSVPIPDNLVKKAEDQAGPIHPGMYWYDHQAGFWGVAGGQCLGIIPPFIEEFNYPMTRDCAGGRTGIFVNKRELHHIDRDKLCRRGLPDTPGMSYHIEIDGRVVEEATGSELRSLGRLAPSLEKSGRGTGMHVPS